MKLRRYSGWVLLAVLSAVQAPSVSAQNPTGPPAVAAPAAVPLTLEEAVRRALARQPLVNAATQRVRQAEYHLRGSLALPSTTLDIGHGQTLTQPGATGNDQDILISQHLELFGQRRLRGDQARRELEAARESLAQARADAAFQARTAFAQARSAAAEEELARQAAAVAETFLKLARAQYDAGDVPIASVLRAEIEVESAAQALLAAQTQARVQQATLNAAMAQPLREPVAVPTIDQVALNVYELPRLLELAQGQPALKAAQATLAARHSAVSVARAAGRPEVMVDLAHDQLQDWPGGNVFRVGFVFPIWDHGVLRAAVDEARAAVAEQQANVAALRQQAELDVTTAFYSLEQARELVQRSGGPQLQRSARLYELARLSYSEGLTSYLDLLDAQQVLRTATTGYLRAMASYEASEAALEKTLGQPLPPPKSSSVARYAPPPLEAPTRPK